MSRLLGGIKYEFDACFTTVRDHVCILSDEG